VLNIVEFPTTGDQVFLSRGAIIDIG